MRLNKKRQEDLEPERFKHAFTELSNLGYSPIAAQSKKQNEIRFLYKGNNITYWPYSGWHSGKGIKAGRGFKNLLKQLK